MSLKYEPSSDLRRVREAVVAVRRVDGLVVVDVVRAQAERDVPPCPGHSNFSLKSVRA